MEISKDNYPYNRKFILIFLLCKILKEDERMFKNTKGKEKGITLIALVITIIVLLILAGISISMLTGQNRNTNKSRTS